MNKRAGQKQAGAQLPTSTVMFVEFSRGGSLQKHMKEVLERLSPMLGFRVRVAEKGGSSLGSILSNKNLWRGEACGRSKCKPCAQPEEKKESCKTRNIVYESECTLCNEPGSRKQSDKKSLKESKEQPNLYVGESARSLCERAGEHWEGALGGKEENHMLEHLSMAHRDEQTPSFRFRIVKKCKTALERQVREAVRIEMRGNILNKKGMFNRCKLTRMVVDSEWDQKVWEEAWEPRPGGDVEEEILKTSVKSKSRQEGSSKEPKRARRDDSSWGEECTEDDNKRAEFLHASSHQQPKGGSSQSKLKVFSGLEWMMRELLKEVAHAVIEISDLIEGAGQWEEWEESSHSQQRSEDPPQHITRSKREERQLWAILSELDKKQYHKEQKEQAKKLGAIARARKKMGADSTQPSIFEKLMGGA